MEEMSRKQTQAVESQSVIPSEIARYLDRAGRVVIWPAKRSLRLSIFAYLAAFFEAERMYSEREVNAFLSRYLISEDYATIRRDMCDFRYLRRERDGSRYWRA